MLSGRHVETFNFCFSCHSCYLIGKLTALKRCTARIIYTCTGFCFFKFVIHVLHQRFQWNKQVIDVTDRTLHLIRVCLFLSISERKLCQTRFTKSKAERGRQRQAISITLGFANTSDIPKEWIQQLVRHEQDKEAVRRQQEEEEEEEEEVHEEIVL